MYLCLLVGVVGCKAGSCETGFFGAEDSFSSEKMWIMIQADSNPNASAHVIP
jgi:hypothetical protein